jgi:hypothetical protein
MNNTDTQTTTARSTAKPTLTTDCRATPGSGEVFKGMRGNYVLRGTPGDDIVFGFGGDDAIDGYGEGGHDALDVSDGTRRFVQRRRNGHVLLRPGRPAACRSKQTAREKSYTTLGGASFRLSQ